MCAHVTICVCGYICAYTFCMGNAHMYAVRIGGEFLCTVSILVMKDDIT